MKLIAPWRAESERYHVAATEAFTLHVVVARAPERDPHCDVSLHPARGGCDVARVRLDGDDAALARRVAEAVAAVLEAP